MKISLEWLKDYVDYTGTVEELAELFTGAGFPVEARRQVGDDWMFDVEVTSNRSDCLGHIGLAREVAAVTGDAFHLPSVEFDAPGADVQKLTSVDNQAPDLCRRYTARVIENVQTGPSPAWMQKRLETIGLRSISNVVDITNYVLMEIGQPLHSFDYDRLADHRIVVRRAQPGERIETIDHTLMQLQDNMLVIADAKEPVALAGIMGGAASEVSDQTKTVLLESAHFAPLNVRRTSRTLTLSSEASFRFERNVDIDMLEWASRRATALLIDLAGGTPAKGLIDVGPGFTAPPQVTMRIDRLNALVGIQFEPDRVLSILQRLGFQPQLSDDSVTCTIPSWRWGDVTREADLIEEIIRIHGYNTIPTEQKIHITVTSRDKQQHTCTTIREALSGCGYDEAVNVGFIEDHFWKPFAPDGFEPVRVNDASRKSNNALRFSLLPSLLANRKRNQDVSDIRCDLYELAAAHHPATDHHLPTEQWKLALLCDGDLRELRGAMQALLQKLDRSAAMQCTPCDLPWAAANNAAQITLNGQTIGHMGRLNQTLKETFDLQQSPAMAELDFDALMQLEGKTTSIQPLPRFPGIQRDLSLVVNESVTWAQIQQTIEQLHINDLCRLEFVDIYRGKGVEKGKKSLTLSMEFRRGEQTLRHEQVDQYQQQIVQTLQDQLHAVLRT